jgi:hypothetical protein
MGTNVFEEHITSIFKVQNIQKAVASPSHLPKHAEPHRRKPQSWLSLPENLKIHFLCVSCHN